MTKRAEKIIYWLATFLMFAIMGIAIVGYHLNYTMFAGFFEKFGYPAYIIYPLAYLKLAALVAILTNKYRNLKDIAYGAYFINMMFATAAHVVAGEQPVHAYIGIVVIIISYVLSNRVRGVPQQDAFILSPRPS